MENYNLIEIYVQHKDNRKVTEILDDYELNNSAMKFLNKLSYQFTIATIHNILKGLGLVKKHVCLNCLQVKRV